MVQVDIKSNQIHINTYYQWNNVHTRFVKLVKFMFQYSVLYGEFENEKKKGKKMAFPGGDLNPGFLNKTDAKQFRYSGSSQKTCRRILGFLKIEV